MFSTFEYLQKKRFFLAFNILGRIKKNISWQRWLTCKVNGSLIFNTYFESLNHSFWYQYCTTKRLAKENMIDHTCSFSGSLVLDGWVQNTKCQSNKEGDWPPINWWLFAWIYIKLKKLYGVLRQLLGIGACCSTCENVKRGQFFWKFWDNPWLFYLVLYLISLFLHVFFWYV